MAAGGDGQKDPGWAARQLLARPQLAIGLYLVAGLLLLGFTVWSDISGLGGLVFAGRALAGLYLLAAIIVLLRAARAARAAGRGPVEAVPADARRVDKLAFGMISAGRGRPGALEPEQVRTSPVRAQEAAAMSDTRPGTMSELTPVNLAEKLSLFSDQWTPRVVGQFNGHDLMVARLRGEFVWHAHADSDDFFYVLRGTLEIEMEDHTVTLREGEMFVVPAGTRHRPVARDEVQVLLIEREGIPNTGDPASAAPKTWI